ncbi:MAG: hypothetical protein LBN95_02780 [Prevotellaceae bacterium]|jgi:hypothetical protein|nr:hypothetical protein [Prevotellaceae bacterium]
MAKLSDDKIRWILELDSKGVQGELKQVSSVMRELEQENKNLAGSNRETVKEMKELEKQMLKLEKAGKENTDAYKNLSSQYNASKQNIAENTQLIDQNNKKIVEQGKKYDDVVKSMKITDMTMNQLKQRAASLGKQLDETSMEADPKAYKALQKELTEVNNRMFSVKNGQKSLLDQFSAMHNPIGSAAKSVKGFGQALKALIMNPVGIIIMAIVAAFYALKTAIAGSDSATTKMQGVMKALNSILDTGKRILTEWVKLLFNIVTFNFKGIKENAKNIAELTANIKENAVAAYEAALAQDALEDAIARNNDVTAVNKSRIEELRQVSNDATKSLKERIAASEEILRLEKENYKMSISNITGQFIVFAKENKNLIDAMKHGSKEQMNEVSKYMQMIEEGTELTYEQRLRLAELVNDITTTLDAGTEEEKEKFRSFFSELSKTQEEYFSGSRRDAKRDAQMKADDAKKALENRLKQIDNGLQKELLKLKQSRTKGLITEDEFNKKSEELTKKSIEQKLKIQGLGNDKIIELQEKLLEYQYKQAQERAKILSDAGITVELETKNYNDRLKAAGVFEKDYSKLTDEQRQQSLKIEEDYQAKLLQIASDAETKRFAKSKQDAGVDGDATKFTEEQNKVLEILTAQHRANIQNINDASNKKIIDANKIMSDETIKQLQKVTQSQLEIIDNFEKEDLYQLELKHKRGLISDKKYEKEKLKVTQNYNALRYQQELLLLQNLEDLRAKGMEIPQEVIDNLNKQIAELGTTIVHSFDEVEDKVKSLSEKLKEIDFGNDAANGFRDEWTKAFEEIEKLRELDGANWKDWGKTIFTVMSAAINSVAIMVKEYQEYETASLEAEKQKQLTIAGDNAVAREKVEKEFAQKELDLKKKQANANAGIQIAQAIAGGALAIITAFAQLGPIGGAIAAALIGITTALEVATIIKQRNAIMNTTLDSSAGGASKTGQIQLKEGYADGGYTGNGGKYQVAATASDGLPIHKGEYVIAQEEMKNPSLVPMIRAIDREKQKRSRSNPLPQSYGAGYADGGFINQSATQRTEQQSFMNDIYSKLSTLFANPLKAEIIYSQFENADEVMNTVKDFTKKQ